jgi:hypothetical protein
MRIPRLSSSVARVAFDSQCRRLTTFEIQASGACGTGWHESLVPDRWNRADFTGACRNHDQCYGLMWTQQGRLRPCVSQRLALRMPGRLLQLASASVAPHLSRVGQRLPFRCA